MLKATLLVTALVLGATGVVRADPLLDACQTVLLDRLISPSSYKEVEVTRSVVEMSPGEWYAQEVSSLHYESADEVKREHTERTQREFERMMRDGIRPALSNLTIEFDASNAYGAIIRGRARCSHYETGTGIEPSPQNVGLYLLDQGIGHCYDMLSALRRRDLAKVDVQSLNGCVDQGVLDRAQVDDAASDAGVVLW